MCAAKLVSLRSPEIYNQHPELQMAFGTQEERMSLAYDLIHVAPGDTVSFPVAAVEKFNENFNRRAKTTLLERVFNLSFPTVLMTAPIITAPLLSPTVWAVTAVALAHLIPMIGHAQQKIKHNTIECTRWDADREIGMQAQAVEEALIDAATKNFVQDFDDRVMVGEKLTLPELAQLVNVDADYLKDVCEDLAITVLTAKAALGIQKGDIEHYVIDSSKNRGFAKGVHSDLILSSLWKQHDNQVAIEPKENPSGAEKCNISCKTPLSLSEKFKAVGSALRDFYIDGLKNLVDSVTGTNPKAKDYLRKVDDTFTIPVIKTTPDLKTSFLCYGIQSLDLPALEPISTNISRPDHTSHGYNSLDLSSAF